MAFWDGVAAESDAFVGIEDGSFGDETTNAAHSAVHHVHRHFAHLLVTVSFPERGEGGRWRREVEEEGGGGGGVIGDGEGQRE